MSYLRKINTAIDFIEANLGEDLGVDTVAQAAGLSRWHFQRIFTATLGETVTSYVEARRLSLAAAELRITDARVIDIAFALGFGSHETFSRAFKRLFGLSPSAFRAVGQGVTIPHKPRVTTEYLKHLDRGITMEPTIQHIDAFTAVGLAGSFVPIDQPDPDNMTIIPRLWQGLRARADDLPMSSLGLRVGVIGAQPAEDGRLDYLAGRILKGGAAVPAGFDMRRVPAGTFAVFTHKGPVSTIGHTLHYIFGAWLPRSGRTLRDGAEFERYPETYDPTSDTAAVEICIPIS